jgi:hypothetical protein
VFQKVKLEESNEELKMDLGGYMGDFHRHRIDHDIKKRVALTEAELVAMMAAEDRLKEVALAFREIDPDRNGYVTQQELDDIFRENYSRQMEGKNMFGVIKGFLSITNKILVDYNKFKSSLFNRLKEHKRALKDRNDDSRQKARIIDILSTTKRDDMESRLNESIKNGRLTEDLLSEVKSLFDRTS